MPSPGALEGLGGADNPHAAVAARAAARAVGAMTSAEVATLARTIPKGLPALEKLQVPPVM